MRSVEITYRYASRATRLSERPSDAQTARRRLDDGNREFSAVLDDLMEETETARSVIEVDARDLGFFAGDESAPKQRPYAAILGCSDARVPTEMIFNEGPNDLFVVRVAGNGLGSDVLGSLKYAVEHLGGSMKLIVVLGHSGCGAVSAAVDVFLRPDGYLGLASNHSLRNILDRLLAVVHASAQKLTTTYGPEVTRRIGYRDALIELAVVANAAFVAYTVQQEIGGGDRDGIRAAYGVYLLNSRRVWSPVRAGASYAGLADPPADYKGFIELADAAVCSERIASLLERTPEDAGVRS